MVGVECCKETWGHSSVPSERRGMPRWAQEDSWECKATLCLVSTAHWELSQKDQDTLKTAQWLESPETSESCPNTVANMAPQDPVEMYVKEKKEK